MNSAVFRARGLPTEVGVGNSREIPKALVSAGVIFRSELVRSASLVHCFVARYEPVGASRLAPKGHPDYSMLPNPCQCLRPMKMNRNCWVIFAWGVR